MMMYPTFKLVTMTMEIVVMILYIQVIVKNVFVMKQFGDMKSFLWRKKHSMNLMHSLLQRHQIKVICSVLIKYDPL